MFRIGNNDDIPRFERLCSQHSARLLGRVEKYIMNQNVSMPEGKRHQTTNFGKKFTMCARERLKSEFGYLTLATFPNLQFEKGAKNSVTFLKCEGRWGIPRCAQAQPEFGNVREVWGPQTQIRDAAWGQNPKQPELGNVPQVWGAQTWMRFNWNRNAKQTLGNAPEVWGILVSSCETRQSEFKQHESSQNR